MSLLVSSQNASIYAKQNHPSHTSGNDEKVNQKIHEAAVGFVGNYLTQVVEQLFETSDLSESQSNEQEFYRSLLSEGLGKKLAESNSGRPMVSHIEKKIKNQLGIEAFKVDAQMQANNANERQHYNQIQAAAAYKSKISSAA